MDEIKQSIKTLLEMLNDRNLNITTNYEALTSYVEKLNNRNLFTFDLNNSIKVIYYFFSSKFKWSDIKNLFEDDNDDYDLYILITNEKLTKANEKSIENLGIKYQIFDIKELQINISQHELVPKHELITDEEEIKNLIEKYNLKTKYQFPHILKSDAMARYLNLKNGDIIKITRISPTSGEYILYRCCI